MSSINNQQSGLFADLLNNKKYRPILISLGVLLVFLSASLLATYYLVRQSNQATERMDLIGDFSDESLFITTDVQHLTLLTNPEDKDHAITALKQRTQTNDTLMQTLLGGGAADHHDHNHSQTLSSLSEQWQQYQNRIYLLTTDTPPEALAQLAAFAHDQQKTIYDEVTIAYDEYYADSQRMNDLARYVQIAAFVGLLSFLAVFVGYVLVRMRRGDALLEKAQKETSDILKTVNEGLFLVNQDLVLSGQYSQSLERILNKSDLQGRRLDELMQGAISQKDLNATKLFIEQLYNPWVVEELIQDLNPLKQIKITQVDADGMASSKYLDFDFLRVSEGVGGDNEHISKVFVSVTDVTDTVLLQEGLERTKRQHERELEMISTILSVDTKHLLHFVDNTTSRIDKMNDILKSNAQAGTLSLAQKAQTLFREMHSLKGDASALKLQAFVDIAEQQESKLKGLMDKLPLSGDDFLGFTVGLDELLELNLYIKGILTRLHMLSDNLATNQTSPPLHWCTYLDDYAQDIAARHGKKITTQITGFDELATDRRFNTYKDIAVQFLKNAIVHGIEPPNERLAAGKPEAGFIKLALMAVNGVVQLSVEDDGGGIDWQKLRTKAVEDNHLSQEQADRLSQKQLYALLLKAGLSTSDEHSEDAGRGMGMSVIYELANNSGGRLQIRSESKRYTHMAVSFE